MKKLKDSDLEVAVHKKFSKLKKPSTKKKVQSMAISSKFVSGNANKKHSQDADVEEAAVIPVIPVPAENSSQLSSSSDRPTESSQGTSTSDEKAKPTQKQDDLRIKDEDSFSVCSSHEQACFSS